MPLVTGPRKGRRAAASLAGILVAVVICLALAASASATEGLIDPAAPMSASDGAFHIDISCDPFCDHNSFYGTAVGNLVTTSSGRAILTYHDKRITSFYGFGCVGEGESSRNEVQVLTADESGVYHYSARGSQTFVCDDPPPGVASVTCTSMVVYTFAHGEVRVERSTNECHINMT